jgi:hypothetical protein
MYPTLMHERYKNFWVPLQREVCYNRNYILWIAESTWLGFLIDIIIIKERNRIISHCFLSTHVVMIASDTRGVGITRPL